MHYKTAKREKIIACFREGNGRAFTPEELCEILCPDGCGRSTLYRQIALLTEEGILRRITDDASSRMTYQYIGGEECGAHLHLKCRKCGRLLHLSPGSSLLFRERLLDEMGFLPEEGAILFGTCRECTIRARREKHPSSAQTSCRKGEKNSDKQ